MFPTLETERLILREITHEDTGDILACFSNKEVLRFYGLEALKNLEEAGELVNTFSNNYNGNRGIRWGIELKGTTGIIGTIGFNAWSPKHKRAEIGYEIQPAQWRKGYALEAVHKVITYGFDIMGLTRIGAVVFIENTASSKLLEKVGFKNEGVLRNYMYQDGKSYDTYVYSILKNDM